MAVTQFSQADTLRAPPSYLWSDWIKQSRDIWNKGIPNSGKFGNYLGVCSHQTRYLRGIWIERLRVDDNIYKIQFTFCSKAVVGKGCHKQDEVLELLLICYGSRRPFWGKNFFNFPRQISKWAFFVICKLDDFFDTKSWKAKLFWLDSCEHLMIVTVSLNTIFVEVFMEKYNTGMEISKEHLGCWV